MATLNNTSSFPQTLGSDFKQKIDCFITHKPTIQDNKKAQQSLGESTDFLALQNSLTNLYEHSKQPQFCCSKPSSYPLNS